MGNFQGGQPTISTPDDNERFKKIEEAINFLRGVNIDFEDGTKITFTDKELEGVKKSIIQNPTFLKIFLDMIKQQSTEGFVTKFKLNVQNLQISPEEWKTCVLEQPSLFVSSPETIKFNIEGVASFIADILQISKEEAEKLYISKIALKHSFIADILQISKEEAEKLYISKIALKQPSLFTQSPETIKTKFDLYNLFINQEESGITDYLITQPSYFTLASERIMAFYVLAKLMNKELRFRMLKENPLNLAREMLFGENREIFETLYEYFRKLFERRRRIKRKITDSAEIEAKTTLRHAEVLLKYFGPKEQTGLTPEQIENIKELVTKVRNHLRKEELKKNK
ncbi:MAG: hypothetical protein KatS3mg097_526 [Candidatus Parcubacteria bacterium]|nr:MAG: hypothetical protein KatS3mg097_526 [Candidatus Parcubacteria bacterium]